MTESHLFYVMEYCPGGDLFSQYCDSGSLKEDEAAFYIANIVLILEDLHERGVIHRDIKSENFLIDSEGYLRLSDFGDSKDNMHSRGRAYTLCGTSQFMAPEVVEQSQEGYDFSCEWWGLGCVLYDMLCGQEPFPEKNQTLLKQSIQNHEPFLPKWVSNEAQSLIKQMMDKSPKKRMEFVGKIKSHPFLEGVNWDELKDRKTKAFFHPEK